MSPTKKRYLKDYSLRNLEAGFMIFLYRETINLSNFGYKDIASFIYENSLDKIINEHTKFISNAYKSFEPLFIIYLAILISILVFFALANSITFIKFCFFRFTLCFLCTIRKRKNIRRFVTRHFIKLCKLMKQS